jgi:hypothetical protein
MCAPKTWREALLSTTLVARTRRISHQNTATTAVIGAVANGDFRQDAADLD